MPGSNVVRLGIVPTPGVAFLTADSDADLGVMLSASHNPMPDNGIKFFARGGNKLDDALENAIESRMREAWARPTGAGVGRVTEDGSRVEDYISHLVNSLSRPVSLEGLKVVVDCANGAAYVAAPAALEAQGAEVVRIHAVPDGININDNCGSTHMDSLRAAVVAERADLGIALDGDADRCLAVDAAGRIVDGDQILAILALALREAGRLKNDTVVATVMSLALGVVDRIEEVVASEAIRHSAGQLRVQLGEAILPLAGLDNRNELDGKVRVFRLNDGSHEIGYAFREVIDLMTLANEIIPSDMPGAISGVTLIDGEPAELIDAHWLFADYLGAAVRPAAQLVCRLPEGDAWMQNMLRPIVEAAGYLVIGEKDELSADITIVSEGREVDEDERWPSAPPGDRSGRGRRPGQIYRYDRAGLLIALKSASAGRR